MSKKTGREMGSVRLFSDLILHRLYQGHSATFRIIASWRGSPIGPKFCYVVGLLKKVTFARLQIFLHFSLLFGRTLKFKKWRFAIFKHCQAHL